MAEYKAVRITGGAVADLSGGKRTRKRKVKGDPDESPSMSKPSIPLESFKNATITKVGTTAGGAAALMPVPPPTAPFPLQAPALSLRPQQMQQQPQPQQSQPMQQQMQGGKQIRVELKKIQSKR